MSFILCSALFVLGLVGGAVASSLPPLTCPASQSQPDPLLALYPNDVTGTANGTISLLPVPWSVARAVIPSRYQILSTPCQALLPGYCDGTPAAVYPLLILSFRDHGASGPHGLLQIPDFSRVNLLYPFVDVLGDGYTSFAYAAAAAIEVTSPVAILGYDNYGPPLATAATFDPPCEPYNVSSAGVVTRTTTDLSGNVVAAYQYAPVTQSTSFTLAQARNLTNQPITGAGLLCDNFIILWNSSVTTGQYAPVPLTGNFSLAPPLYPLSTTFHDVEAFKADIAFVERGDKSCLSLQGYTSTGSGD